MVTNHKRSKFPNHDISLQLACDLLTSAADVPGRPALRTASRGDFIVPRTNRKFGDRAFCVAAPRVWNRLPADLRQLRSTHFFRRHLKTFLFAASYWAPINSHSWTNAPSVYCRRRIRNVLVTVTITVGRILLIIIIIIIIVFNKSWQAQAVQNIDSELYNTLNDKFTINRQCST